MGEAFEGVVFRSDERTARRAFGSLASPLRLRLVRLARGVFGIYRVAGRADPFDPPAVEAVATRVSAAVGRAVALFSDNSCGVRAAVVFAGGRRGREFGGGDEWWVPLDADGEPLAGSPRLRISGLWQCEEYERIHSALDAGLATVGAGRVSAKAVLGAFCYDEAVMLAEAPDAEPGAAADGGGV